MVGGRGAIEKGNPLALGALPPPLFSDDRLMATDRCQGGEGEDSFPVGTIGALMHGSLRPVVGRYKETKKVLVVETSLARKVPSYSPRCSIPPNPIFFSRCALCVTRCFLNASQESAPLVRSNESWEGKYRRAHAMTSHKPAKIASRIG